MWSVLCLSNIFCDVQYMCSVDLIVERSSREREVLASILERAILNAL